MLRLSALGCSVHDLHNRLKVQHIIVPIDGNEDVVELTTCTEEWDGRKSENKIPIKGCLSDGKYVDALTRARDIAQRERENFALVFELIPFEV